MPRRDQLRGAFYLCGALTMLLWVGSVDEAQSQGNTFTGRSVRVEAEGVNLTSRGFDAGARTHWHTHSAQLLFVKEGSLRYQIEGGSVTDIGLHETTYLPRGVPHWHGATPSEPLTHISVTFPDEHGNRLEITWGEPVTDDQYER